MLARVAVDLVERAQHGGDRCTPGHRVGEHGAAAGQPEAGVVQGHGEPGAERLHPARALGHLEQARRDVGHPDVALERPAAPRRSGRGRGPRGSETTSATIERLTWPSRRPLPPPLHAPLQGKRSYAGPVRAAATRRGHHPGDDQPQPAAPVRPLAGGSAGLAAAARRAGARSWSTSATAPRRSPRSSCTTGCGGCARTSRWSASRSTRPGWRAARPLERPGLTLRARRVRGAPARWRPAGGGAGVQRAAAVRRGRGGRGLGDDRAPGWPPRACSSTAPATSSGRLRDVGGRDRRRAGRACRSAAAARAAAPGRGRRAAAQGADPPQRARRAGAPASSPSWTPRGRGRRRRRRTACGSGSSRRPGALRDDGWPVLDGPSRWRLGELTVAWDAVAPGAPGCRVRVAQAGVTRGRRGPGCPGRGPSPGRGPA